VKPPADGTRRFSARVADYARFRPGYPPGLIETLKREIGLSTASVVADIGSGTGISSEPFLRAGCTVFAVEPNDDMRRAAEERLGALPGYHSVAGRAEATGLEPVSVDLVVAGQAVHWFEPRGALAEFRRILKPDGHVALFWNSRRTDTPFNEACERVVARFAIDDRYRKCQRGREDDVTVFFEGPPRHVRFPNHQTLDLEGLRGRVLSSSYAPLVGHPNHEPLLAALDELFERYAAGGHVRFEYETELYIGGPAGRSSGSRTA